MGRKRKINGRSVTFNPENIRFYCDICGKEQEPDEEKSNQNWKVYLGGKCECGGEFKMKEIGKPKRAISIPQPKEVTIFETREELEKKRGHLLQEAKIRTFADVALFLDSAITETKENVTLITIQEVFAKYNVSPKRFKKYFKEYNAPSLKEKLDILKTNLISNVIKMTKNGTINAQFSTFLLKDIHNMVENREDDSKKQVINNTFNILDMSAAEVKKRLFDKLNSQNGKKKK